VSRSVYIARAEGSAARAVLIAALAAVIGALAPACSYPTAESPYPGQCFPLQPVAIVPAPNSVAVPTDVQFRITFNDYPDPDTVRSDSLLLTTGYFCVPGNYGADLIGKAAVMSPIRGLSANVGYGLHLRPVLSSLSGCPGTIEDIEFRTAAGPAGHPAAVAASFDADIQPIFEARCAGGCHLGTEDDVAGCAPAPAGGLSLCAADSWAALVGQPSNQTVALRRVEPGDSARSYLLRKLLPATGTGGPIAGVYGQREPPGDPLPEDQLRLIASWIDGGALRKPNVSGP